MLTFLTEELETLHFPQIKVKISVVVVGTDPKQILSAQTDFINLNIFFLLNINLVVLWICMKLLLSVLFTFLFMDLSLTFYLCCWVYAPFSGAHKSLRPRFAGPRVYLLSPAIGSAVKTQIMEIDFFKGSERNLQSVLGHGGRSGRFCEKEGFVLNNLQTRLK